MLPDGRRVRLIDTAGCDHGDAGAIAAGQTMAAAADLLVICQAPDAQAMSLDHPAVSRPCLTIATKADLGPGTSPADLEVSVYEGRGLDELGHRVAEALGACADDGGESARLCAEVLPDVRALIAGWPGDEVLADRLAGIDAALGVILGQATAEDVLDQVFARFCIGK